MANVKKEEKKKNIITYTENAVNGEIKQKMAKRKSGGGAGGKRGRIGPKTLNQDWLDPPPPPQFFLVVNGRIEQDP